MQFTIVNPSDIKNKEKRQKVFGRRMHLKQIVERKAKMRRKREEEENPELKKKRLEKNQTRTIENMREKDETMVEPDDEEVMEAEAQDDFDGYFNEGKTPKILITTSKNAKKEAFDFADELSSIFTDATFVPRQPEYEISHICKFSYNRGYTDVIIITENHKKADSLTMIHLPEGPSAHFKLSSIQLSKKIHNHGRVTAHIPELILNNFNTRLGHTIGRFFASLFPHVPQLEGRQVCTLHNQRDFIFFRRHRYQFKDKKRVGLQELGPRFTLKLQWLQKGIKDLLNGEFEWVRKPEMDKSRKKFFL